MENYLDTLNPSQRAAVEYCDGPQLVIAGAGSGKTRVLTVKIAHLLKNGYQPNEIIALTFTKKAATEMQERIQAMVGGKLSHRLWMGTFHSLFSRILRLEAERLGFKSDFTIYDQQDSRNLVKTIIKEMGLDEKQQYKTNSVHGQISNAKNNLITPGMYSANAELIRYDAQARRPLIHEIYQRYWMRCRQAGAMDFDDLLLYTNILFRDHPDVLQFYQDYFKYVLVDEYQDTNRAQHLIVEQLVRTHKHLMVVGDDAQSIYSFRGANIRNILDLRTQIPETRLFKLEQNYRSTQNIVDAANSLIAKNREQIQKTIFSEKERGSLLRLTRCYSDLEESYQTAQRIQSLHDDEGTPFHDIAILYRTNAQSRTLEESLRKRGIEYRVFGGLSFYQRAEVKDVVAILRLIVNPSDEESFRRVLKAVPFGIGETTIGKIGQAVSLANAQNQPLSFFDVLANPDAYVAVNSGTKSKLARFYETLADCRVFAGKNNVYDTAVEAVRRFRYNEVLAADTSIEGMSRKENVQELLDSIQQAVIDQREAGDGDLTITEYLSTISLDEPDPQGEETVQDYVSLMTIHQAKGLEFKNVFIVGVEENLLPSDMSIDEPSGVEEERRLFYVAITRAEENCYLSYATSRFRNGKSQISQPSRFLKDIDARYIQREGASSLPDYAANGGGSFDDYTSRSSRAFSNGSYANPFEPKRSVASADATIQPRRSPLDLDHPRKVATYSDPIPEVTALTYGGQRLQSGTRIQHDRFGQGTITALSGGGGNERITVHFDTMGDKTLLLKFAKFTLVE